MPYIMPEWRKHIDHNIDMAAYNIKADMEDAGLDPYEAGVLAYVVYRLMLHFVKERGWGNLTRVWTDVTLGAGAYFKKHEIDPYEDEKLCLNGPVEHPIPF